MGLRMFQTKDKEEGLGMGVRVFQSIEREERHGSETGGDSVSHQREGGMGMAATASGLGASECFGEDEALDGVLQSVSEREDGARSFFKILTSL